MNRGSAPLELSDEYWAVRDGIVQAELLITRMLKFDLNIVHPHKVSATNKIDFYKLDFCTEYSPIFPSLLSSPVYAALYENIARMV